MQVSIVQRRKGGQQFALKYINKAQCIAEKAVHHVVQERNLLEEIRHPFICNLRYSFQDADNLYMALDLMTGGDLRFHLSKPFKEAACRGILAEIASALEYLHAHTIVHRDIKPDVGIKSDIPHHPSNVTLIAVLYNLQNILLDCDGHAYLTDFNIAVKFREERPLKSVAGTEPYMAPELLLGNGYFASVDWWSLGVMAYEIMLGERPFRGKNKRDLIKKSEWSFPKSCLEPVPTAAAAPSATPSATASSGGPPPSGRSRRDRHPRLSEAALSFISGLMTTEVSNRLGCGVEGKARLRAHPYLETISWEKLIAKELVPVFVPPRNKANFDATHDLEEILLNDTPLGSKPKNKRPSQVISPEMLVIERQFLYYDYSRPDFVDSQATTASPIQSMDLIKLRESCVSVDSTLASQTSILGSVAMSSRSQGVPESGNGGTPGLPPMAIRRALSGAQELAAVDGFKRDFSRQVTHGSMNRGGQLGNMVDVPPVPPKMILDENSALRFGGLEPKQSPTQRPRLLSN
ncbi:hypothetical protein HKX48_005720 [Thoreauomyces humboldtii]|nr:hypothetical protein HKX48_005720 [Thoreauomyces humboldtii]